MLAFVFIIPIIRLQNCEALLTQHAVVQAQIYAANGWKSVKIVDNKKSILLGKTLMQYGISMCAFCDSNYNINVLRSPNNSLKISKTKDPETREPESPWALTCPTSWRLLSRTKSSFPAEGKKKWMLGC